MKVDAYEIFIYNAELFAIERNGAYGNAARKLEKAYSIKIPI